MTIYYYYVRKGGTAGNTNAGRTTTPRTGAWNADPATYYDNINEVFGIDAGSGTIPVDGDYIFVSDQHSHTLTAEPWCQPMSGNPAKIKIISVDDQNQEEFKAGAQEARVNDRISIYVAGAMYGVTLSSGSAFMLVRNDMQFNACVLACSVLYPFTIPLNILNTQITNVSDGVVDIGRYPINMVGGLCSGSSVEVIRGLGTEFKGASFSGVDFSGLTSLTHLVGLTSQLTLPVTFHGCKLPSGVDYSESAYNIEKQTGAIVVANCGQTSAEQEYQLFWKDWAGETEHNTSNYRNESTAWEISGSKTSLVTDTLTQAVADIGRVHSFVFPTIWAELSDTDQDTLTLYLSCDDTLTDTEVWAEVYYPDGTNRHQPNSVSSRNADILAAGTELTADGDSTWTGGGSNKYKIVIDTSGDPGGDCIPTIRVNVATQSVIYWCHTIGLS